MATNRENPQEDLSGSVRVMQIIVAAPTMGLLWFLANVCPLTCGGMCRAFGAMPLLTCIAFGLAATTI